MAETSTVKAARALVELTGNNPRRYVPGTAHLAGRTLTWTEQCKAICRHTDGGCYAGRCALLPSGDIDPDSPTRPGRTVGGDES